MGSWGEGGEDGESGSLGPLGGATGGYGTQYLSPRESKRGAWPGCSEMMVSIKRWARRGVSDMKSFAAAICSESELVGDN